nr:mannitol dehydrogenase family protein [Alphaproteobacteria bacterium]
MTRLSDATLSQAAVKAAVPAYARQRHGIGVVHLGNGAFHRAHQGVYFDDLLAGQGGDWAIASVSLRQPDVRDRMVPQDGLYTVIERETAGEGYQVVGAIRACLFAPEERDGLLARLAAPETKLVTLTITEKGYCRNAASGALQEDDPDIRHDLEQQHAPKTALGFLAEGLARRRADGIAPFTVLSCDNLPHNGASLR